MFGKISLSLIAAGFVLAAAGCSSAPATASADSAQQPLIAGDSLGGRLFGAQQDRTTNTAMMESDNTFNLATLDMDGD